MKRERVGMSFSPDQSLVDHEETQVERAIK
jgi:hypothetical protein